MPRFEDLSDHDVEDVRSYLRAQTFKLQHGDR